MNVIDNLKRVIITLDAIKTDNKDGNWDRLLGCRQMLINCIGELQEQEKQSEADETATE